MRLEQAITLCCKNAIKPTQCRMHMSKKRFSKFAAEVQQFDIAQARIDVVLASFIDFLPLPDQELWTRQRYRLQREIVDTYCSHLYQQYYAAICAPSKPLLRHARLIKDSLVAFFALERYCQHFAATQCSRWDIKHWLDHQQSLADVVLGEAFLEGIYQRQQHWQIHLQCQSLKQWQRCLQQDWRALLQSYCRSVACELVVTFAGKHLDQDAYLDLKVNLTGSI